MIKIKALNENTLMLYFSNEVSDKTAIQVANTVEIIKEKLGEYLIDMVPSYTSLMICYDILKISSKELSHLILKCCEGSLHALSTVNQGKVIEIPVYYGLEVAWDARVICRHTQLEFSQIIKLHSETVYRVYAIGFTPGFAYLGTLDPRIAMERKTKPRAKVPAGSLGIADQQTAIYPKSSPGGWQIIGRTPVNLIDFSRPNLTLFEMGAKIKFKPIDRNEFNKLGGKFSDEDSLTHKEEL